MYKTITEIKEANKNAGLYFFSPATLRFFNSKIESKVLKGQFFVTSERQEVSMPKQYTVRKAREDGSIGTVGGFQEFNTIEGAKDYISSL